MPRKPENCPIGPSSEPQIPATTAYWKPPKKPCPPPMPSPLVINDAAWTAALIAMEARLRAEFIPMDIGTDLKDAGVLIPDYYFCVYNIKEKQFEKVAAATLSITIAELDTILAG